MSPSQHNSVGFEIDESDLICAPDMFSCGRHWQHDM
jgi:hypothetical protein